MASIFTLNDDCLCNILSFLHDPDSFYNFVLTCKRFTNVAKNTTYLQREIFRRKADFYLKKVVVQDNTTRHYDTDQKLEGFFTQAANSSELKNLLTGEKIVKVWQKNGPVAARLFSWIRSRTTDEETGEPRATCRTQYTNLTLHLPSSDQCMTIATTYFCDYNHIYDDEMTVEISCGDMKVSTSSLPHMNPCGYSYYDPADFAEGLRPLQPARDLLSNELGLGETKVKLTDNFFFWLCFFFPMAENLSAEDRLEFEDASKNIKPSPEMLHTAVAAYRKETDQEFGKLVNETWRKDDAKLSESFKSLLETIEILVQRSETKMIRKLGEDASRIITLLGDYELRELPRQLILCLLLRTSLNWSNISPGSIADKHIKSNAKFRVAQGEMIAVKGKMEGDGAGLTSWFGVRLEFVLPDGREIKVEAGYESPYYYKSRHLKIEELQPLTQLIQGCVNRDLKDQGEIPEILDSLTAAYFLAVLEFNWRAGDFLKVGKLLRENEEESSAEEEESSDSN